MTSDIAKLKHDIRQTALQTRAALQPSADAEDAVADYLRALRDDWQGCVVAGYWPIRGEFSPLSAMLTVAGLGAKLALPVIDADIKTMDFAAWDGQSLLDGPWGTKQPPAPLIAVKPDVILCPLLAFDRRGNRVGYGGGYYDVVIRTARADRDVAVYGIAFGEQAVLFPLPAEEFDEKLDAVITPERIITFR